MNLADLNAVDLFGGPGGWDIACHALGFDPLGIEWDDAACATREAVGLRTLQADVSELDPSDYAPCELVIASAPCPTYSSAGNGGGRHLTEIVVRCLHDLAAGNDTRAERRREARETLQPAYWDLQEKWAWNRSKKIGQPVSPDREKSDAKARRDADMSLLVVEPLRWVVALEPRWVALEQVPEVLPLWSEMAQILGTLGYSTWAGVLMAEQYGVPQTRKRAILLADREGQARPPAPTHAKYVVPKKEQEVEGLFEAPREVDRIVRPEDRGLLPWVSMAEALGWVDGPEPSPAPTVSGGGTGSGGGVEVFAGRDARRRVLRANAQQNAAVRGADEPAPTITGGHDTGDRVWVMEKTEDRPERKAQGAGNRPRPATEPAATIDSRADLSEGVYDRRQSESAGVRPRPADEPAPTICGSKLAKGVDQWTQERPAPTITTTRRSRDGILVGRQLPEGEGENIGGHNWTTERPSTTVNGDPRISKPGRHDPEESGSQQRDATRVTLEEAAILQSFPPDYPFQGTKSQRFLQVGNAVPPLLAHAILSTLLAPVLTASTDPQPQGAVSAPEGAA